MSRIKKLSIIGAGSIGSKTLEAVLRIFPPKQKLNIVFYNRTPGKPLGFYKDVIGTTDINSLLGKTQQESRLNNLTINPTSDISDIADSDAIIFTKGISATFTKINSRNAAAPVVMNIVERYAKYISRYVPNSTIILTVGNPTEIVASEMHNKTGHLVIGSSTELDARRFRREFFLELKARGFHDVRNIKAEVIGGHSEDNMILVEDSIRIVYQKGIEKRRSNYDYNTQDLEKINEAYEIAKNKMQTTGFDIIDLANEGSSFEPAILLATMARAFLYGSKHPINITGAISLSPENTYQGIDSSVVSAPLSISKGKIVIDHDRLILTESETERLNNVAEYHENLINEITNVPPSLVESMEQTLSSAQNAISDFKKALREGKENNAPSPSPKTTEVHRVKQEDISQTPST